MSINEVELKQDAIKDYIIKHWGQEVWDEQKKLLDAKAKEKV